MATALALQEVEDYKKRTLLDHLRKGSPLLAGAAVRALGALIARAWRPHPLGWTLHEELLIILMKELLSKRDLGVWRALFSIAGGLVELPDQVRAPILPGSKSFWVTLRPGLQVPRPRASFNLVFIHGGAFIAGSALQYVATYDCWLKRLAAEGISCKVLTVHYPLAPESPYPAGRDACEEVLRWLADESGETDPFIVGSDSAGANLALSALAHMRDEGRLQPGHMPRSLLLISPAMDLSGSSCIAAAAPPARGGAEGAVAAAPCGVAVAGLFDYLPREHVAEGLSHYYVAEEDLSSPYVSPMFLGSFEGLVEDEVMVISGGAELMLPDVRRFYEKLQAAEGAGGPRASYYEAPGQVHSWPVLMLPGLEEQGQPMWSFFNRAVGLE